MFHLRQLTKNNISTIHTALKENKNKFERRSYDDDCTMYTVDNSLLPLLREQVKLKLPDDTVIHYVIYDVKGFYKISQHRDNCKKTIIVYLEKDESITDTFYIENTELEGQWKKKCLVMKNNALHSGTLTGFGKREVLCLFI